MPRFAMVECSTWDDPDFLRLSPTARLLFLWSWTHQRAAICGLYMASEKQMMRGIGGDSKALADALAELGDKPLVKYDADAELLWVVNRARYSNRSPKVARAMQREVEACPDSPLIAEFVALYGSMLELRLKET